ncbi:hypothetical protein F0919_04390 [Taibaiella lutea]|uniref:Uncharacterized protein n=1 Tax=Taibaiella lutea TaxID=2608001 RepID=A0A5M6CNW6_9BACT|nr:hypothetical protein [Taibaiella lutea]KAA5536918.1 hypothetical protein F0919_04390 [Taibaiella lutea]
MENNNIPLIDDELDIRTSKTSTSRFFFLMGFFGMFIFAWAGCYKLWTTSFHPNDQVKINKSSLYNPEYETPQ